MSNHYVAIYQQKFLAKGFLDEIIQQVKAIGLDIEPIVIEVDTCQRIDFSWQGSAKTVLDSLPSNLLAGSSVIHKRGRPKLGVKSKEVTLLPRHWEWLARQRGGASATLRRLVEEAQKNPSTEELILEKQQQLDTFMSIFLADETGYEEASRALYRNSRVSFDSAIQSWPADIKQFVLEKFNQIHDLHNG
ncbi:MAG: DUF2239 family protein [Paraglaciecola sp.]